MVSENPQLKIPTPVTQSSFGTKIVFGKLNISN